MADKPEDLRLPPLTQSVTSPRRRTERSDRTPRTGRSIPMSLPPLSSRSKQSDIPSVVYHSHVVYGSPLWHRDTVQTTIKPLPTSTALKDMETGFVNDAVKTAIYTRPRKIPIIPEYYAERDKYARAYFKSPLVQDTMARASKSCQPIKTLPVESVDSLPAESVDNLPAESVDNRPTDSANDTSEESGDNRPGEIIESHPSDPVNDRPDENMPDESIDKLPVDNSDSRPGDNTDTRPAEDVDSLPNDTVDNLPVDSVDHLPADDGDDTQKIKPITLWPNEKYSTEYPFLPDFIVRLYTEEYDVAGTRKSGNKLSMRHRCRSTPNTSDLAKMEREFVNDAIITEKKRTKYKDIIPPYDASRDKNARAYFMRQDVKHLLGVTRSAR